MPRDVYGCLFHPGPQCQPITFPARPEFQGSLATEEMQGIAAAQGLVEYKQLQKDNVHNAHQLPWERHGKALERLLQELGHYKLGGKSGSSMNSHKRAIRK